MKRVPVNCRKYLLTNFLRQQDHALSYPSASPVLLRRIMMSTESCAAESSTNISTETETTAPRPRRKVACPENSKLMKISIIGLPNAGKSTLTNALTNYEVCPVSSRPHTTRNNQKGIYLDEETQLVIVDTPGVVSVKEIKKFSFTREFVHGPEQSIGSAQVIAVVHDISNSRTREKLDFRVTEVLQKFPEKKSILILNKVDTIKRKQLLLDYIKYLTSGVVGGKPLPVDIHSEKKKQSHLPLDQEKLLADAKKRYEKKQIDTLIRDKKLSVEEMSRRTFTDDEIKKGMHERGWPYFDDIFMVSALKGDGINMLRRYLIINATPHDWLYEEDALTDVPPNKLVLKILQAKLLEVLPHEIPFKVKSSVTFWNETDSGEVFAGITIRCPKERYKWRIVGNGGALIKQITEHTQTTMCHLMGCHIHINIDPIYDKSMQGAE